ncbi:hypothetical protein WKW80_33725 [Variovorax humicola]|uniref:Transposase n=1 Tax=Variovorax humicola TaxID=1769758 RepID=A0ABU8WA34_9BURK
MNRGVVDEHAALAHHLLTEWFNRRFAAGRKLMRRVGIVAVARKLAIALWPLSAVRRDSRWSVTQASRLKSHAALFRNSQIVAS